jgi:hypothetical protein
VTIGNLKKRVFYTKTDLDEHIAANPPTKHRSTSEYAQPRAKKKDTENKELQQDEFEDTEPIDGGAQ